MNPTEYTEEQKKDITERVEKARARLLELKLHPACMPQMANMGDDVFGVKLVPYLQDTRYTSTKSPMQYENL